MSITLTPVESSQIAAIGHSGTTLAIQFKNKSGPGAVYHYQNFPAEKFKEFMETESKGRYFGMHIKGKAEYPYTRQEEKKDGE